MPTEDIFLKLIVSKSEPPVKAKWRGVYDIMAVHTQNKIPTKIFEERRPEESKNAAALKYRCDNYRPVTNDEFGKAISDYLEIANNLDCKIVMRPELQDYLSKLYIPDNLNYIPVRDFVINKGGAYRQTDSNAVFVVLPKHPTDEFVPSYQYELPNFDNIINTQIDVDVRMISHASIIYASIDSLLFRGGSYEMSNGKHEGYYWGVTKDQTWVIVPEFRKEKGSEKIVWVAKPYYANKLTQAPFVVLGGEMVMETDEHGNILEYYIPDFAGAAAWGDMALAQMGDLQISEQRFSWPRHWRIRIDCDNHCIRNISDNRYYVIDSTNKEVICPRCKGDGHLVDTTPLGSTLIKKGDTLFGDDGRFQQPEGFITPPAEILKHSADRTSYYYHNMQRSLCLSDQNMTNQSGESKRYDIMTKVAMNTRIVMGIYQNLTEVYSIIDQYIGGDGVVKVIYPDDFNIQNANDILFEITEAKKSNLPYILLVELTKKYMLKKFGNTPANRKIFDFLAIYDKLFAYGLEDMQKAKAIFGSDITQADIMKHSMAYSLLQRAFVEDESLLDKSFAELALMIDTELSQLTTITSGDVA
jgi:type III secretion system FlhB-like substrate exporter